MEKMTLWDFTEKMMNARKEGKELTGVIVFKKENWTNVEYSLEARSYKVGNWCNWFDVEKISQALWATTLDGSDKNVRLDYYINSWDIDYCYIENE